ncbi:MAG: hypothetical protein ACPG8W_00655 [Candidatus Promineifilaceae bacterium]
MKLQQPQRRSQISLGVVSLEGNAAAWVEVAVAKVAHASTQAQMTFRKSELPNTKAIGFPNTKAIGFPNTKAIGLFP